MLGYTWKAMCSQKVKTMFFDIALFWEILSYSFQTQMEVYNKLQEHQVKEYLDLLNLQGWKWWESEGILFARLSICSLTYIP
jgi:hypothetical protein